MQGLETIIKGRNEKGQLVVLARLTQRPDEPPERFRERLLHLIETFQKESK